MNYRLEVPLLGIGGPVTYKNSRLPDVLAGIEATDIVLETDAPWLPPVPYRGQRNEPAYLKYTAMKVAQVLGLELSELMKVTNNNFDLIFLRESASE